MQSSLMIGLALAVSAPIPKDPPKKDPPSLVGEWLADSAVIAGKVEAPPPSLTLTFTKDGKCLVKEDDEDREMTFTFDPKKEPAEIDISDPRAGMGTKAEKGIYKIEGDTLIVCIAKSGDRPKAFASAVGSSNILVTLKRPKKD
jgi:uncharacterized protein (TIGR03067 family)